MHFFKAVTCFVTFTIASNETLHAATPVVEVGFNDKGLSSLQIGGKERLQSASPQVTWIRNDSEQPIKTSLSSSSFDSAGKTLVQTYSWGVLTLRYTPTPQGVDIAATIENRATTAIGSLGITFLSLNSFGANQKIGEPVSGIVGPALIMASGVEGTVVIANKAAEKPLQLTLAPVVDKTSGETTVQFRTMLGGKKILVDQVNSERTIPSGGKEELKLSVRLGGSETKALDLAQDVLQEYRTKHPMALNWTDRRPILRMFFGGGISKESSIANMKDPESVRAPEPDTKFQTQLLAKIKGGIEAAKQCNAQAMILWDLEGGTFPHATTYIGDPRLIRLLNPQMDLIIDEGIKMLRQAGVKVGVTLRPSRVVYDQVNNTVKHSHADAEDPFKELSGKVEYSKKRWGCEVFYVDTNFFWRPYGPEKKWQSGQIASDVWKRLLEKYPDTLFIPEFGNVADYPYTCPYTEADMGGYGASELIRALWPEAFQVVVIEDADPYENFDRFVGSVRNRNPLMTQGGGAKGRNVVATERIYRQAKLLETGLPSEVKGRSSKELAALLQSPEEGVRFHASHELAKLGDRNTAPTLLAAMQDENQDWLVRRNATLAFSKINYPEAVPVLVGFLTNTSQNLEAAATRALAGQSPDAATLVLIELKREALNPAGNTKLVDTLGSALAAMKAVHCAPEIQKFAAQVPEGKNNLAMKRTLVTCVADLRDPASEAFFLQMFEDETLRDAAARGLVLIGSEKGIAQSKSALAEASKVKNEILVKRLNEALKAK